MFGNLLQMDNCLNKMIKIWNYHLLINIFFRRVHWSTTQTKQLLGTRRRGYNPSEGTRNNEGIKSTERRWAQLFKHSLSIYLVLSFVLYFSVYRNVKFVRSALVYCVILHSSIETSFTFQNLLQFVDGKNGWRL